MLQAARALGMRIIRHASETSIAEKISNGMNLHSISYQSVHCNLPSVLFALSIFLFRSVLRVSALNPEFSGLGGEDKVWNGFMTCRIDARVKFAHACVIART